MLKLKRIYDPPAQLDGYRVLVDRLWPRGLSKSKARVDFWMKEIGPTDALRKWFGHDPRRWTAFRARYWRELRGNSRLILQLKQIIKERRTVTLLFGARDEEHNQAVALQAFLQRRRGSSHRKSRDPPMTGPIDRRFAQLRDTIVACRKCPRLVEYREEVARTKRRAYREWTYWGRPVPSFGDPHAKLLIIGLAPAAHGANRTGRMFTGDRSGDFLYGQLHRAGFANQASSRDANDGLALHDAYISAAVRCAPPDNKPLPAEILNCSGYLEEELDLLQPRVILALGAIAFDTYLRLLVRRGAIASRAPYTFSHGAECKLPRPLPLLFASYHPSQQNTQTGRLTPAMFHGVLRRIQRALAVSE